MKKSTLMQSVVLLAMFAGLPITASVVATGCDKTATQPVQPPAQVLNYGYQVLTSMDTLYITTYPKSSCGELTGGDTIGKIPYSDNDSLWAIVERDNY